MKSCTAAVSLYKNARYKDSLEMNIISDVRGINKLD